MGPVHQSAEVVPLVQPSQLYAVAHAERHALCEVDIVRYEEGLAITDVDNESLVR
jgi:hypothetical protein